MFRLLIHIYRELELKLRIKPKKRLVREKPEPLAVPVAMNKVWLKYIKPGQPQQNAYIDVLSGLCVIQGEKYLFRKKS